MTQTIKPAALLAAMLILMLTRLTAFGAAAEGTAVMEAPAAASPGESFDLILTLSSESPIAIAEGDLAFDSDTLSFTSGSGTGSGGIVHFKEFSDSESTSMKLTLTFTPITKGDAVISLSNCVITASDGTPANTPSCSVTVKVTDSEESSTAETQRPPDESEETPTVTTPAEEETVKGLLKTLTVSEGELMPEFSPLIFDYVVKVGHEVEVFEVDAELSSDNDYIWFEGSKKLSETGTVRTVTVQDTDPTDENQTPTYKNVYKIVVERAAAPETTTEEVSSEEEQPAKSAVVTTAEPAESEAAAGDTELSKADSKASSQNSSSGSKASGMSELRKKMMPWLIIILIVLVLALCIMIVWIKNKSKRKRRKITSSNGKK